MKYNILFFALFFYLSASSMITYKGNFFAAAQANALILADMAQLLPHEAVKHVNDNLSPEDAYAILEGKDRVDPAFCFFPTDSREAVPDGNRKRFGFLKTEEPAGKIRYTLQNNNVSSDPYFLFYCFDEKNKIYKTDIKRHILSFMGLTSQAAQNKFLNMHIAEAFLYYDLSRRRKISLPLDLLFLLETKAQAGFLKKIQEGKNIFQKCDVPPLPGYLYREPAYRALISPFVQEKENINDAMDISPPASTNAQTVLASTTDQYDNITSTALSATKTQSPLIGCISRLFRLG
jgi:hypothetical protein